MLDYWVRLYRRYQLPITQVIVLLKATSITLPEVFQVEGTQHHYQIVRMWEQNPAPFLENTALLPLREGIMRESVIYQEILQEGREEGREEGRAEGKQAEAIALIMRQLSRRIGTVEPERQERIQQLSITQLEDLAEALLDFSCAADLAAWLQAVE